MTGSAGQAMDVVGSCDSCCKGEESEERSAPNFPPFEAGGLL